MSNTQLTFTETITSNRLSIRYDDTSDIIRHLTDGYFGAFFGAFNNDVWDDLAEYYEAQGLDHNSPEFQSLLYTSGLDWSLSRNSYATLSELFCILLRHDTESELMEALAGIGGLKYHASKGYSQGDYLATLSEIPGEAMDQYLWGTPLYYSLKDTNGEFLDSCAGFYDLEDIREHLPAEYEGLELEQFLDLSN